VTEYHTDPDGKRWERLVVAIADGSPWDIAWGNARANDLEEGAVYPAFRDAPKGSRIIIERPEPEMEEWVRLDDVRFIMSDMKGRLYDIEHGTIRRLPKSESRR
jgi:hypothetical protein